MPPTLERLVRAPALGLTVLAGAHNLSRGIRWVHTSELADPTPYLEGGELLLTTGMKLGRSAAERRAYVERLADAGVAGLGVGVGLSHATVPAALVAAAEERGLPLFSVPRPTPFIAIGKLIASALAADEYEAVTKGFAAQQELTRSVLGPEGTAALIRDLAGRVQGWAALYDAAGDLVHVTPAPARPRALALAGDVDRLRALPAPASAALTGAGPQGERAVLQSLGADRRIRGFLAVGTDRPLSPVDRQTVGSAGSLLTLALEQSRTLGAAEARMRTALLRLWLSESPVETRPGLPGLRAGASSDAPAGTGPEYAGPGAGGTDGLVRGVARDLGAPLPEAPVLVAVAHGPEQARGRFSERLGAHRPGAGVFAAELDGATVLVAPGRMGLDGDTSAFEKAVRDLPGLVVGVSAADRSAARAYRQARQVHAVGDRTGRSLTVAGHEGTELLQLLGDDAVHGWAEGVLAPLAAHDAGARGDLVASLRAWLARHGQWDAAAGDLGVHRHTLRYRIRRAEEILGRRLDDPDVRAELWLALRVTRQAASAEDAG